MFDDFYVVCISTFLLLIPLVDERDFEEILGVNDGKVW